MVNPACAAAAIIQFFKPDPGMGGRRRRSGGGVAGTPAGGIALVVVVWTWSLLLSLVAAGFMAVTRTEVQLARYAVENARAEALADGRRLSRHPGAARAFVQRCEPAPFVNAIVRA